VYKYLVCEVIWGLGGKKKITRLERKLGTMWLFYFLTLCMKTDGGQGVCYLT